jgi:hypothetical protein
MSTAAEWMKRGGRRIALIMLGVMTAGVFLRLGLLSALDLRDLPGAGGADTLNNVAWSDYVGWDAWFIGIILPFTDGPVGAAHTIAQLSGLAMVLGAMLGGLAISGPAGALAGGVVASAWSMAVMPTLLIGADPPGIGMAWLGTGLVWISSGRSRRWLVLAGLGTALVVLGIATKPLALPALGLLPIAPLCLSRDRREAAEQTVVIGLSFVLIWVLLQPGVDQHEGGLEALGILSPFRGIADLFSMRGGWPDGALYLVLLATLLVGLLPGAEWRRRAGIVAISIAVLGLTAAGLGTRICPRLLLASAFGCVVCLGVLPLLIGHRLPVRMRWAPLGLLGGVLLCDTWGWVVAWDEERVRFTDADSAELPAAPWIFGSRYQGYAKAGHQERLRDLSTAGATSLMSLPEGTTGVAIPPLRDRREQHLAVAASLAGVPLIVLEEEPCCVTPPTTFACAERVVRELSASGVILVLPEASVQEGMIDPGNPWVDWLRAAAESRGELSPRGSRWSILSPQGSGSPLPCRPRYPPQESHDPWPPTLPFIAASKRKGGASSR